MGHLTIHEERFHGYDKRGRKASLIYTQGLHTRSTGMNEKEKCSNSSFSGTKGRNVHNMET